MGGDGDLELIDEPLLLNILHTPFSLTKIS